MPRQDDAPAGWQGRKALEIVPIPNATAGAGKWRLRQLAEKAAAAYRRAVGRPPSHVFYERYPIALRRAVAGDFAPSNDPGTCLWCGAELKPKWPNDLDATRPRGYGSYEDSAFCTLRCGYSFGVTAARLDFRLTRRPPAKREEPTG